MITGQLALTKLNENISMTKVGSSVIIFGVWDCKEMVEIDKIFK